MLAVFNLRLLPRDVEAEQLGDLYAEMGDKGEAAEWYRKARLPLSASQIRVLGPRNTW